MAAAAKGSRKRREKLSTRQELARELESLRTRLAKSEKLLRGGRAGKPPSINRKPGISRLEKQAKNERASSFITTMVENAKEAVIGKNADHIIESWNQGAERIYGYTAREAIGKPISILLPPDRAHEATAWKPWPRASPGAARTRSAPS